MSSDTALSHDAGTEIDAADHATAARRSLWRWLVAGLVVGLLGLGIRGWLYQQPYNSDDVQYFTLAQQIGVPSFSDMRLGKAEKRVNANSLRFVFLSVPASTSALLGDGSEAFYSAIYVLATFSFVGIFALAWVLSGPRTAVIAAVIWATSYAAIAVDTRLVPDNFGTALALIGLALIAYVGGLGEASGVSAPRSRTKQIAYAAIGGFLLWASFSTRASFFVFAIVGVVFAMLGKNRWRIVGAVVAGGLLGEVVELLYFAGSAGDPFMRWRTLLGFGVAMTKTGTSPESIYAGYNAADLFTRYPRILWATGSAEIWLHFVGLGVFVWWVVGWKERQRLAKAICGLLVYGFLAFAITRVDPVVPLMREKVRYYATAAPIFYIAVAELASLTLFREIKLERFRGWVNGPPRMIAAGALVTIAVLANVAAGADSPQFARNGNDGLQTAAEVLESDVKASGRPKVLYQDMRTSRVMSILLPAEDGWARGRGYDSYLGSDFRINDDGYLLLNWKRLNANVRRRFGHGPRTHNYYRIIEKHPLVARHRRGGELVDLFFISKNGIERDVETVEQSFPRGWSRTRRTSRRWEALSPDGEVVFAKDGKWREYVYSGEGPPWKPPPGTRLPGERFVQARFEGRAERMTKLLVYLYWWREGGKRATQQYMGTVWLGPETREYAAWTYLPQDARAHRLVLRADPGAQISKVTTRTLGLHPADQIRQFGGAWPKAIPNKVLAEVSRRVGADARARERPRLIYDELDADRVVKLMPKAQGWALASRRDPRGAVLPPVDSYLLLSWDRLYAEARASFESARVHRYYRSIEDHLLVYRHYDKTGGVDVFFAPAEPIARPVVAEDASFPRGWSRLLNSTKKWGLASDSAEFAFTSEDPNDEYVYSGDGPVWRKTVDDTTLDGKQFVEVIVEARAGEITPLRGSLFWWPEGQKEPRRQPMGMVLVGPRTRQLALWTYLPRRATSHRLVFRSKAGVILSKVRARVLGRLEGDRIEQRGGAW